MFFFNLIHIIRKNTKKIPKHQRSPDQWNPGVLPEDGQKAGAQGTKKGWLKRLLDS